MKELIEMSKAALRLEKAIRDCDRCGQDNDNAELSNVCSVCRDREREEHLKEERRVMMESNKAE